MVFFVELVVKGASSDQSLDHLNILVHADLLKPDPSPTTVPSWAQGWELPPPSLIRRGDGLMAKIVK